MGDFERRWKKRQERKEEKRMEEKKKRKEERRQKELKAAARFSLKHDSDGEGAPVEEIRDKRRGDDGDWLYYVKWVGWDSDTNTWEPVEHLAEDCKEKLEDFERRWKKRQERKEEKRMEEKKKKKRGGKKKKKKKKKS